MDVATQKILVVDDDTDTCCNLADLFNEFGHRIDTAAAGNIAIEHAQQRHYDVALLDLRMPGMDGLTLCRNLKQIQPTIEVVIVTASGNCVVEEALQAGARYLLPKPIDFPKLLKLVEATLARAN